MVLFAVCRISNLQGVFCTAQLCFIAGEMGSAPNLDDRQRLSCGLHGDVSSVTPSRPRMAPNELKP